jgi:small redox-active disulfide protein 2
MDKIELLSSSDHGKTIRVGKVNIGLIGLNGAISSLRKDLKGEKISPEEAGERLFDLIKKKNYVPCTAIKAYKAALASLWMESEEGEGSASEKASLTIRILGPGCVSCNRLEEMVREALDKRGIPADIEHVHDLDEIWRYGVFNTPSLVINEKILCSGRLPTRAKIETWFRELI